MTDATAPVVTAADLHARQRQSQQRIMAVQERAMAARATLADSTVTKSSQDQSVTLTVNPGGGLVRVTFGPSAEKKSLAQLSTTIMQTYRVAAAAAVEQTMDVMREVTGETDEALAVLRANVPPEIEVES